MKFKPILIAILTFAMTGVFGQNDEIPEFSMTKGMCYGSCPEFTIEVYKSKYLVFRGIRNTSKLGVYKKELTKSEYKEICKAFKKSNFDSFDEKYDERIMDISTVSITHHKLKKTVSFKLETHERLHYLETLLSKYAHSDGAWIQLEKAEVEEPEDKTSYPSEIIILVSGKLEIEKWAKRYHQYGLMLKKKLSPNNYYWLISFDSDKIPPKRMLMTLINDPEVVNAQFNQKIQQRNK